jgi:hypothetical protein
VSGKEFAKIVENLHGKGWSMGQTDKVKMIFRGDMDTHENVKGIGEKESAETLDWMREHKHEHGLSDHQIGQLHEEIEKHFRT